MPRLPVKRTRVITTVEEKARLVAGAKFRTTKQGITDAFIRMLDRIDPLEAASTIGMTWVIYDLIKSVPELIAGAQTTLNVLEDFPWIDLMIRDLLQSAQMNEQQIAQYEALKAQPDFPLMLKSFALAYLLIHNSSAILNGLTSAGGGVASYVAGALGFSVVAA